jgi:hypothetical protein
MTNSMIIHCCVCGRPAKRHEFVNGACRDSKCQRAAFAQRRLTARTEYKKRYEKQLDQATFARSVAAKHADVDAPDTYVPVVTPANTRSVTPLPRRRRYRFMKQLLKLIKNCEDRGLLTDAAVSERMELARPSEPAENDHVPAVQHACANCLGRCCRRGGTHAFLDEFVLQRFKAAHPNADSKSLLTAYCSYLPERSYKDSCVFHTELGCGLPREMRSRTCNRTICAGLVEINLRSVLDDQQKFFLAATNSQGIVRTKFVDCEKSASESKSDDQ